MWKETKWLVYSYKIEDSCVGVGSWRIERCFHGDHLIMKLVDISKHTLDDHHNYSFTNDKCLCLDKTPNL